MPKITPERKAQRRGQILMAAVACFARDGFHATTIKDICAEAGLSTGAVYSYFPSKDAIIQALAEAGRDISAGQLAGDREATPADRLGSLFMAFDRPGSALANRLDLRLWAEAIDNPHLREVYLQSRGSLIATLSELAAPTAAARGLAPQAMAEVIAAVLVGCEVQRALEPEAKLRPVLDALLALLAAGTD